MNNKLFVGNISWDATEDDIKKAFEEVGTVEEVHFIIDKFKNRHKGFGFVTMATEEEAMAAKEKLNDREIAGRQIKIDIAKPKEDRPRDRQY